MNTFQRSVTVISYDLRDRALDLQQPAGSRDAKPLREASSQELQHNCISAAAALCPRRIISTQRAHKSRQRFGHTDAQDSRLTPDGLDSPRKDSTRGKAGNF